MDWGEPLSFGPFEFEPRTRRLTKHGHKIKLQPKAAAALSYLMERQGEVVSREQLQRRLWPEGTYVDFELGIKVAIKKVRDALDDAAEDPVYIQTVHGEGYRFIALAESRVLPDSDECALVQPSPPEPVARKSRRWLLAAAAAVALAAAGGAWLVSRAQRPTDPVWLLVTALDNRTGEPLLDESVPFLLEREISNSSGVYVAPRIRVEDTLKLMRKDLNTRVDEALGRELCLRDGGIGLIATSRAERVGSAYLIAVDVREAASGRLLGGASEQARTLEEIAPAVRRLASAVRIAAGDHVDAKAWTESGLEHVTTSSLRACQLYSEAYRQGTASRPNWDLSERLAHEAITEDPGFASAHLWLAWAMRNQHKSEAQWRAHLQGAVGLSKSVNDRERQFILASQKSMLGNDEEAVLAYRRMLVSYPDDYWARNNLVGALLRLGRTEDAWTERYRFADLRPNDPQILVPAMYQAVFERKFELAHRYMGRLRGVINSDADRTIVERNWIQFIDTFPLHELWIAGKLDPLRAEIDRKAQEPPADLWQMVPVTSWYQTLGRLRDAETFIGKAPARLLEENLVLLAYLRDDPSESRASLKDVRPDAWPAVRMLLVRGGERPDEMNEILRNLAPWVTQLIESRVAALDGDPATAARKIEQSIHSQTRAIATSAEVFIARATLARAYEQAGDDAAALRNLEAADMGRGPLFFGSGRSSGAFWHRIRYEEARLLRKLGRQKEAEPIEAELRRDLRLADPDHPILVRLSQRDRRPLNVY